MKTDPWVNAYIAAAAPFAQPILRHLRELVHRACPTAEETKKWSFPNFVSNGKILCSMAAFKAHCTFGFWHQEMEKLLTADGHASDEAMGLMGKITCLTDLPEDRTLIRYLKHAVELNLSEAPSRPRPAATKAKQDLVVPADLRAALKQNKAAAKTFDGFSHSHRKEYVEWITEAKRPETRAQRLATTLEWLAEGKARNWKYANC